MDQVLRTDGTPMRVWGSKSQEQIDAILAEEAKQEEAAAKEIAAEHDLKRKIVSGNAERAAKMSPKEKAEAAKLLGADDEEAARVAEAAAKRASEKGYQCGCGKFPREGEPPATLRSVQGHARRMGCKPENIVGPDGKKVPVVGMGG